jgi:GNAT superfamily N-acetyltransferase
MARHAGRDGEDHAGRQLRVIGPTGLSIILAIGEMRRAHQADIPLLLELMASFYGEFGYKLDRQLAAEAFATLLSKEHLGRVWLIDEGGQPAGYVIVTFRFGMEYGGFMACLDDLFVLPEHRNRGLGTGALHHIRAFCEGLGIRAITVEAAPNNGPAQKVYRRLGLTEAPGRQLLVLPLAKPAHAV